MLEEYEQIYKEGAIDSGLWDVDKNELIRLYVESGEEKYLSAAIYKFWYVLINKISNNRNNRFIEPEDFYGIFIDSIISTCHNALWKDPSHSLYEDKKAPEKSINTIFNSKVINYFHACNRQKRKSIYETVSLTDYTPVKTSSMQIEHILNAEKIDGIIVELFNKKDYYSSYILDLIVNNDTFDFKDGVPVFKRKRLKKLLMNIDNSYCEYFASRYDLDLNKVLYSLKYIKGMSYNYIDKKIDISMNALKTNKELYNMRRSVN